MNDSLVLDGRVFVVIAILAVYLGILSLPRWHFCGLTRTRTR